MPKPFIDGGSWRRVFTGYEAFIESKAGASPPQDDWPLPEPREPNCPNHQEREQHDD